MSLDTQTLRNVANLARLHFDEEKAPALKQNLNEILDMVDELSAANTADVKPMAHPLDITQRLRPDAVTETDQHAHFQENAPAVEDAHFLVPKVIEG